MARKKNHFTFQFTTRGRNTSRGWANFGLVCSRIWLKNQRRMERDYLTELKAEKIKIDSAVADMRSEKLAKENYLLELKIKQMEHQLKMQGVTVGDFRPLNVTEGGRSDE